MWARSHSSKTWCRNSLRAAVSETPPPLREHPPRWRLCLPGPHKWKSTGRSELFPPCDDWRKAQWYMKRSGTNEMSTCIAEGWGDLLGVSPSRHKLIVHYGQRILLASSSIRNETLRRICERMSTTAWGRQCCKDAQWCRRASRTWSQWGI